MRVATLAGGLGVRSLRTECSLPTSVPHRLTSFGRQVATALLRPLSNPLLYARPARPAAELRKGIAFTKCLRYCCIVK
eukprot:5531065-Pyramimonas_sp.AAC.2